MSRDERIYAEYRAGRDWKQMAQSHHLSVERLQQICGFHQSKRALARVKARRRFPNLEAFKPGRSARILKETNAAV